MHTCSTGTVNDSGGGMPFTTFRIYTLAGGECCKVHSLCTGYGNSQVLPLSSVASSLTLLTQIGNESITQIGDDSCNIYCNLHHYMNT